MKLLYYVALPYTEEILNFITLFAIDVMKQSTDIDDDYREELGLFIYKTRLALETIDHDLEWLLNPNDAIHVLALYAAGDFNSVCEYLNNLPNKPFTVCIDTYYLI